MCTSTVSLVGGKSGFTMTATYHSSSLIVSKKAKATFFHLTGHIAINFSS